MRCHRRLHFTRFFQTAFLELRIQFLDFYCFVFRGGVGYFEKYEKYRAFPAFRKVHSAKAVSPLFAFNDTGFHVPFQHPVFVTSNNGVFPTNSAALLFIFAIFISSNNLIRLFTHSIFTNHFLFNKQHGTTVCLSHVVIIRCLCLIHYSNLLFIYSLSVL